MAPAGAAPVAPAVLSKRTCHDINTGDNLRQLSVCSSVWNSDSPGQSRGVVDMHTYKLSGGNRVGDSVSQTITLGTASLRTTSPVNPLVIYGSATGPGTCRLNGPGGPSATARCRTPRR